MFFSPASLDCPVSLPSQHVCPSSEGILTLPVFKGVSAGCQDQILSCSQPCSITGVLRSGSGRPESIGGPSQPF